MPVQQILEPSIPSTIIRKESCPVVPKNMGPSWVPEGPLLRHGFRSWKRIENAAIDPRFHEPPFCGLIFYLGPLVAKDVITCPEKGAKFDLHLLESEQGGSCHDFDDFESFGKVGCFWCFIAKAEVTTGYICLLI